MKKRNKVVLVILVGISFNPTFSMNIIDVFWKKHQEKMSILNNIKKLEQKASEGDHDSIIAFSKFEQVVNNPEKQVTELRLKRILDSFGLIDSDGKVNNNVRNIYKQQKK